MIGIHSIPSPEKHWLDKGPEYCIREELGHNVCNVVISINMTELNDVGSNGISHAMVSKSIVPFRQR